LFVTYIEKAYICDRKEDSFSHISLTGKLIKLIWKPRQASILNGGPQPSGSIYAGGLQRGRALKSCHTEFHHITDVALYKKTSIINWLSTFLFVRPARMYWLKTSAHPII